MYSITFIDFLSRLCGLLTSTVQHCCRTDMELLDGVYRATDIFYKIVKVRGFHMFWV